MKIKPEVKFPLAVIDSTPGFLDPRLRAGFLSYTGWSMWCDALGGLPASCTGPSWIS